MSQIDRPDYSKFKMPPVDEGLCVPELYDWQYHNNPTEAAFLYSRNSLVQHILYRELVPAIHRAGRLVAGLMNIDVSGDRSEYPVTAVISAADSISNFTVLISMLRLGVVCFPISPRFSAPVVAHLLRKSGATHVFVEQHNPRLFLLAQDALSIADGQSIAENRSSCLRLHDLPLYDEMYGGLEGLDPLPRKCYNPSSPAMIVHSSNSTSDYPKAVVWTVQLLLQTMMIPARSSHNINGAVFGCHSLELFHPIGLNFLFWVPAYCLKLAVFKPSSPAVIPTAENAFQGMRDTGSQYVLTHTRFLEEWWRDPEKVSHLISLRAIIYGGRLLKQSVGGYLANRGVKLCILYGSTESGTLSAMPSDDQGQEWEYFQLNPQCTFHFIDQGDGSFLAVAMRTDNYSPPVINAKIMGKDACSTGDLLVPHPTKLGHWKVIGRLDDQTMLLTGEVINPVLLETLLCESPHISAAIIFGRSRIRPGVLLELLETVDAYDPQAVEAARQLVWPNIESINDSSPRHCSIEPHMIIFVQPDKPLVRNPKGYPKRAATLLQYQHEIDTCYKGSCDPLLIRDLPAAM